MNNKKGSIIVSKPGSGEILSMVSFPSFDLNSFIGPISNKKWEELNNNKDIDGFIVQLPLPSHISEKKILDIQEKIVDKVERFKTWEDFVEEAVKNTVVFWSEPEKMMGIAMNMWPDFTSEMKATVLIKGVRGPVDYDYELQMAGMNSVMNPNIETIFLISKGT